VTQYRVGSDGWYSLERRISVEGYIYDPYVADEKNLYSVSFRTNGKITKIIPACTKTCGEINTYAKNLLRMMKLEAI
jgi:hypothetical protein